MTAKGRGPGNGKWGGPKQRRHRPFPGVTFDNLGNVAGCWCYRCGSSHRWAEPCKAERAAS